ncbi:MAG TPA: GatB/YqeY domain-containing protein [Patescibacteria group bacterium]|nr:GatB/YqeY domain-containing protein [Patescibacteria group bacterium]
MVKLLDQIEADFIQALKSKDKSLDVLRMLKSALKNAEIAKKEALNDTEILLVIQKEKKQRQDSVEEFTKGNRLELVAKEKFEISILEKYLPKGLNEAELTKIIDAAISETGAKSKSEMGKVMSKVMPQITGRATGEQVSKIVNSKLA